jgi:hypothetical protein
MAQIPRNVKEEIRTMFFENRGLGLHDEAVSRTAGM